MSLDHEGGANHFSFARREEKEKERQKPINIKEATLNSFTKLVGDSEGQEGGGRWELGLDIRRKRVMLPVCMGKGH